MTTHTVGIYLDTGRMLVVPQVDEATARATVGWAAENLLRKASQDRSAWVLTDDVVQADGVVSVPRATIDARRVVAVEYLAW